MKTITGALALAFVITTVDSAQADVSQKVQKAFRGKILITDGPLPNARSTDSATIEHFKKAQLTEIKHTSEEDGVRQWDIDYTAFLKKAPKVRSLSFDFYTADKSKLYVANKGIMGIDPKLTIMNGRLSINEDEGVNRGRTYVVKLTGTVKKREVVFATAKITLK